LISRGFKAIPKEKTVSTTTKRLRRLFHQNNMQLPFVFQQTLKPTQAQYTFKVIEMEKTKIVALTAIIAALVAAVVVSAAYAQPLVGQGYPSNTGTYSQLPQTGGTTGSYGVYGSSSDRCSGQSNYAYGTYNAPQSGYASYPVQSGMGMRGGMMGGYYP